MFKNQTVLKVLSITFLLIAAISQSSSVQASGAHEAFEQENYATAKVLFAKQSGNAESIYYLGRIALIEKQLDRAEDYLGKAVKAQPENANYNYWFAWVSLQQAENASIFSAPGYAIDAKLHFQKALEIEPDHIEAMKGLVSFYIHVPGIGGGSISKAHLMTDRLAKVNRLSGLLSRQRIYRKEEQENKELEIAKILAQQFTHSSKAQFAAGVTFQKYKQYDQAFLLFQTASQLTSVDEQVSKYSALYQIGRTAIFSGQYTKEGVKALESYIKLDPEGELPSKNWAKYRLASLYQTQGNKHGAIRLVNEILTTTDNKTLIKRTKKMRRQLGK